MKHLLTSLLFVSLCAYAVGQGAPRSERPLTFTDGLTRTIDTIKVGTGQITNAMLANSSITINGTPVSLGGSTTISTGIVIGTTTANGTAGNVLYTDGTNVQQYTVVPATEGGTGVSNAGTLTNASNTTITGGGTLALGGFTLTVPATGTAALLGTANIFTAANSFSANGAASTPALLGSGTIFTGGSATTTKPYWLIEPTGTTSAGWSTSGTLFGANAPSGFVGNLIDLKVNGATKFSVEYDGSINTASSFFKFGPSTYFKKIGNNMRWYGGGSLFEALGFGIVTGPSDTADIGFARTSAGVGRISDGSTGRGTLDAAGYQVGGVAGVSFSGAMSSITVVNGIVTAAAGYTATATLDFSNIIVGASADLTITVTGAAVGDSVVLGPPAAPDASITYTAFVSAANTVTVRSHNVGTLAVDQASATFRATVFHH